MTIGSLTMVSSPRAKNIMSVNSTAVWAMENISPLFAPDLEPWEIVAKIEDPGLEHLKSL